MKPFPALALLFLLSLSAASAQSQVATNPPPDAVIPTPQRVAIIALDAKVTEESVCVRWVTANESRTVGYDVQRLDPKGCWRTVNDDFVFAWNLPCGGAYSVVDAEVPLRRQHCYRVIEYMEDGTLNLHGPYVVPVGWPGTRVRLTDYRVEAGALRLGWTAMEGRLWLECSAVANPLDDDQWLPVPLPPESRDHALVPLNGISGYFRLFRVD